MPVPSRFLPLLLLLGLFGGCRETVCDRAAAWAERCDVPWTDADQRRCRDQLSECTARERRALDAFWECMDGRGAMTCRDPGADTGGPPADVAEALLACRDHLRGVPLSCAAAVGVEAGTFGGLSDGD